MNIIIIPAYKPSMIVIDIVKNIYEQGHQAIVVDDGSGASYASIFDIIKTMNVTVLTHNTNLGKGSAIKTALSYIFEHFSEEDIIATMDADGQHTVIDVVHTIREAEAHRNNLVIGVRDFSGKIPFRSKIGNAVTKKIFYLGSNVNISDTQTGLRAFSYAMIPFFIDITGNRYEYEMNMLSYCAKNKIIIREIPIQTIYQDADNSSSHFRIFRDSLLIYKDIIKFTFSSAMSFLVDYVCFFLLFLMLGKLQNGILISNVLARFISAGFNYTMNARFVFKTKKRSIKSIVQYAALAIFILCMNNFVLLDFMYLFHLPVMLAKIMTELVLFIVSFCIQHLLIFKKKDLK